MAWPKKKKKTTTTTTATTGDQDYGKIPTATPAEIAAYYKNLPQVPGSHSTVTVGDQIYYSR